MVESRSKEVMWADAMQSLREAMVDQLELELDAIDKAVLRGLTNPEKGVILRSTERP